MKLTRTSEAPFSLDPGTHAGTGLFLSPTEPEEVLAWPPAPVEIGHLDEFIDRWAAWFALRSEEQLQEPPAMGARRVPRDWRGNQIFARS